MINHKCLYMIKTFKPESYDCSDPGDEEDLTNEFERVKSIQNHLKDTELRAYQHGEAITNIVTHNGRSFAHNTEYTTEIIFCPFCGEKL